MTVKIYAGFNSKKEIQPPGFVHEMEGFASLAKKMWEKYSDSPDPYILIANLQWPSADVVVISRRGMGVIELKHYEGRITLQERGSAWLANGHEIRAGRHRNPYEQVKDYARKVSEEMMKYFFQRTELAQLDNPNAIKLQTAVCFTNDKADLPEIRKKFQPKLDSWEDFRLLQPDDFLDWVDYLRFGVKRKAKGAYEEFLLKSSTMETFASVGLNSQEWEAFYTHMPTGKAYAYLRFEPKGDPGRIFPVIKTDFLIGRDMNHCDVQIPDEDRYAHVSRRHARVVQRLSGVYIQDLSSQGTYINGKPMVKGENGEQRLENGMRITLGRPYANEHCCQLVYLLPSHVRATPLETKSTHFDTHFPDPKETAEHNESPASKAS